jgi:hypothetical protein
MDDLMFNELQHIVLAILQDRLTDEARAGLNGLSEGDWREVMRIADTQGVGPLLFRSVQRLQLQAAAAVLEQLKESLRNNTARNLSILKEFEHLAGVLQRRDIRFMPLKGIYLCSNVYELLGERAIWDIDLIVPVADMNRALEAIETTGYQASRPYDLDLELKSYHHVPVYLKPGAPPLEVHWTLLNPRFRHGLQFQDLWERSVPAQVGQSRVQTLAADDLVIYLCAHVAYQHVYMHSVRSLYDIKLVVQQHSESLGWEVVASRASERGLLNSVYLSLRLVHDTLGLPLPEAAWQALRPAAFHEPLVEAALARILESAGVSPVINAVWAKQNAFQRITGLWGRIFVPRSVLAGRYGLPPNSKRVYLYYFVRARDLLRVHGHNLFDLWFGGRQKRDLARRDSELVAYLGWWQ